MSVGSLLRGAAIDDEINENNDELQAVITRLSSITEMLVSRYGDIIVEVHVDPLNILQVKVSELKELTMYIALADRSAVPVERQSDMKDFARALLSGEFDGVNVKVEDIVRCGVIKCPTLVMYTVFTDKSVEELLTNEYYWTVYFICNNMGYSVSVPYSMDLQQMKSMIVHVGSASEIATLEDRLNKIALGLHFIEYMGKVKKSSVGPSDVYYVPVITKDRLSYGLPYTLITADRFNQQFIESTLNGES